MDRAILDCVSGGKPLLGICLGMQLMLEYSDEHGRSVGLGVVPEVSYACPRRSRCPTWAGTSCASMAIKLCSTLSRRARGSISCTPTTADPADDS